jgi:hypothetical protein
MDTWYSGTKAMPPTEPLAGIIVDIIDTPGRS